MPRRELGAPPDARTVAHDILVRVETTDAFADVLLAHRLADLPFAPQDHALVTRLVYGTLAWQGRLDHHLHALLRPGSRTLETPVRVALRLGLYQLLFLDRVPAYAAVDASVRLARRSGAGAAGLTNAVLRRAAAERGRGRPPLDAGADALTRLAITWSHPRWLVERWATEFDADDLALLLQADNERGATTVRTNQLRTTREDLLAELTAHGVQGAPGRWGPDAIVVARGAARLRSLPAWHQGRFAFQGEASQLIAPLLGLRPGERVLDACAAPGGKAVHVAALVGDGGSVLALDQRPAGIVRIRRAAERLGARAVRTLVADARRPPVREPFDAVLVDAPCSGLGTLRRHPELRWRRRPEDIARLAALQRDIVTAVAPLVRPGGALVYAVCTITREETDDVVAAVLSAHPRFAREGIAEMPSALVTPAGALRTFPHRHGMDGFFAVRLRARW